MTGLHLPLFELLISFTAILLYFTFYRKRKHPNYPPGPPSLPLIGNVHQMGTRPYEAFLNWKQKYGKVFSLKIGLDNAIVINDVNLVKEVFNDSAASGRIQSPIFLALSDGCHGIINTEGAVWEEQRRFVLKTLRDMGFAKTTMEGMILEEAKMVLNWFHKQKNTPISVDRLFNAAVVNSIWSLVTGERSEWQDKDGKPSQILINSNNLIEAFQKSIKSGLMFAPFLRYIIPDLSGWTNLIKAGDRLKAQCDETVIQHKARLNPGSPQDLVDYYLIKTDKASEKSSFYGEIGIKNLKAGIIDLFEAGNETTSATLSWALLYLSHHPIAQQKLIDEIQAVVGKSRPPSLSDKVSLPYTEAVIMEVLRKSALVPMGVFHRMLSDKMFQGYFFPKHSIIISNIYAILHDPEHWGDPENFRPERFLSDDGSKIIRNEALIPFSTGKRQCLGESMANNTLFLFVASIFQKFEVRPDPDDLKPDFQPLPGFINLPKPFRIVMKELP